MIGVHLLCFIIRSCFKKRVLNVIITVVLVIVTVTVTLTMTVTPTTNIATMAIA